MGTGAMTLPLLCCSWWWWMQSQSRLVVAFRPLFGFGFTAATCCRAVFCGAGRNAVFGLLAPLLSWMGANSCRGLRTTSITAATLNV